MTLELPTWAAPLIGECQNSGEDVDVALKVAADYGRLLPQPGWGRDGATVGRAGRGRRA